MKYSHAVLGLVISVLFATTATASGWVVPDRPSTDQLGPIELRHHQIDATIRNQIATTRIEQVFYNTSSQPREGTYYFPVPQGAQIDRFSMFIDGKEVEGEFLNAKKARRIYENIVRQVKDPALLEFAGRGLFRIRVFPFEPRAERRIHLQYTELLPKDADLVSYHVPLRSREASRNQPLQLALHLELHSETPLKNIYSPSHDIEITRSGDRHATVGFESSSYADVDDFKLIFATDSIGDEIGMTVLTHRPDQSEDGYFMLLASPRVQIDQDRIIPKDIVFVLDTSGSMAQGKLDQARRALHFCLDNLNDGDRFEIIRFSTEVEPVFGTLAELSDETKGKARTFIDRLKPTGGTAINDALQAAVSSAAAREDRQRPYMVIFLTDGRPTVGESREQKILENLKEATRGADEHVRIFSFGIGSDVNTYLIDRLAQGTRATNEYVLANEDIEVKVSRFYSKVSDPVLAGIDVAIEGAGRITKMHPGELPDIFHGDQLVLFGRYSGSGDALITLKGSAAGQERAFVTEATFSKEETEHPFVPQLWAARRIGFLLDEIRQQGDTFELREEIARLARKYGIVSPYTAYLILEDEQRRNVPLASRSVQHVGQDDERAARLAYEQMRDLRSGDSAVAASQANTQMRRSFNAQQLGEAAAFAKRGAGGQSQQARLVRDRAFIQNGPVWIDSTIQSAPDAPRVQIEFDSEEYYDLLREHPEAAPWLALGRNVQLLLAGIVYEVEG